VEEAVRSSTRAEVRSEDVGRAILGPLRDLDDVAYLRFASVYSAFESLEDFEAEIRRLRAERADGTGASVPAEPEADPALVAAVVR
jgi:transcriptional repressor NrdR